MLANALLAHGLVDELHLMIGARWLGGGTRYLGAGHDLELLDVRQFAGSDDVVHVCRPLAPVS